MEELSDKEFIQLCAEWPFARLPIEASVKLSLIAIGQGVHVSARMKMPVLLHVLYGNNERPVCASEFGL